MLFYYQNALGEFGLKGFLCKIGPGELFVRQETYWE